jgi:hypothetical protein
VFVVMLLDARHRLIELLEFFLAPLIQQGYTLVKLLRSLLKKCIVSHCGSQSS